MNLDFSLTQKDHRRAQQAKEEDDQEEKDGGYD